MRKLLFIGIVAVVIATQAMASSVVYDLTLEPGYFEVQVTQDMDTPIPRFARFLSSSEMTMVSDEYAYEVASGMELDTEVITRERAMVRTDLRNIPAADGAEVVMGAWYNDFDSLQYAGDRLLFSRTTNIKDIYIALPENYAVIYLDQPATIAYSDEDRVIVHVVNQERRQIDLKIVATRFWGETINPPERLSAVAR
ncbi:hypothetical protein JW905_04375 [bacterium]|nr:hypothetical protein [candidate division CSSED10-310 bacterium]